MYLYHIEGNNMKNKDRANTFIVLWVLICSIILFSLFIIFIIIPSLQSERFSYDLYNQIEYFKETEYDSYLIYKGEKYQYVGSLSLFTVHMDNEDDVMLSWNGPKYFGYIDQYYSYSYDNPLFIYEKRCRGVYFREDYDYTKDVFVLCDTDIEINWEDIFDSKYGETQELHTTPNEVILKSQQYPRIQVMLRLVYINNKCHVLLYYYGGQPSEIWIPSDEFIQILSENGLLQQR